MKLRRVFAGFMAFVMIASALLVAPVQTKAETTGSPINGTAWWDGAAKSQAVEVADGDEIVWTVEVLENIGPDGAIYAIESADTNGYVDFSSWGGAWGGNVTEPTSTLPADNFTLIQAGNTYTATLTREGNLFTVVHKNVTTDTVVATQSVKVTDCPEKSTFYLYVQFGSMNYTVAKNDTVLENPDLRGYIWWGNRAEAKSEAVTLVDGSKMVWSFKADAASQIQDLIIAVESITATAEGGRVCFLSTGDAFGDEGLVSNIVKAEELKYDLFKAGNEYEVVLERDGEVISANWINAATDEVIFAESATVADCPEEITFYMYVQTGEVDVECTIPALSLSVKGEKDSLIAGESVQLTATVAPSTTTDDTTVTWSSSDDTVATVDATGKVTSIKEGTVTITAKVGDTLVQTYDITVVALSIPLTGIELKADKTELELKGKANLTVTYNPADTTDSKAVTWTSSNEEVATVKDGVVTAVGYGEATITAKVGEFTKTVTITVPTVPATAIEATANKTELTVGDKATITTTVTPTNTSDAVTYTSSDEKIVTVKDGVVTAVAEGTAKVTVTAGSVSKELTFTVKAPVVEEPETNTEADSETKTETDTETKTETKTETTTTKLDDLACDGFWAAHTAGIEIKAGTKYVVSFDAKSTDSTQAWFCPVYVVYSNSEAKVDNASADYKEYFVCRGDNWGWTANGDTGAGTLGDGYAFENLAVPAGDDWVAAFKEAVAAGAEGTLTAELSGKNLVITFAVGGVESKATVPVDTSKAVYISLTGEKTNLSNIEVKASKEVKVETKVEKVVTDLGDLACDAFWGAHTAGVEIKAGTDYVFEFDAKSTDATQAWFCPVYVVYTNSAAKVDNASADYKEYLVCRGDNWAWTTNGDSGAGTLGEGYAFENLAVPEAEDWVAAFKEAVAAGAKGTIKAKLSGNNLVITFSVGGVESKATVPVDASKPVYISLTGEKCNLTDITATATTIVKKGDIVNPVLPIALVILGGAVVIVASKKRFA